jgi:hypothetical protein
MKRMVSIPGPGMNRRPIITPIITIILSLIAAVWYSLSDFGGYYWETGSYYNRVRTWEYLSMLHPISGPFMWITVLLFTALIVMMLIALLSKKFGSGKAPYVTGLILVGIAFVISILGAIAVAIVGVTGDYYEWWYDDSCFVGSIAPILICISLVSSLVLARRRKESIHEGFEE